MKEKIRVIELFAGVGGFRIGLEGWEKKSAISNYKKKIDSPFEVVWSNQWEPSSKIQHASLVYEFRFGKNGHSNEDISKVDISEIPDHDLLVGGFPCQDYSVATTLKNSKGLIGKKGVLWWSIHRILTEKKKKPKYILLENVDRLLISPSSQKGRDFAIILQSLNELDYAVEWRIINAADFGMPQRRRRIFILAYLKGTSIYKAINKILPKEWILEEGVLAQAFPVVSYVNTLFPKEIKLKGNIVSISENFNINDSLEKFENTGLMLNGIVSTMRTRPNYKGTYTILKDLIQNGEVSEDFYINEKDLSEWKYLKASKKKERLNINGFKYYYSEGSMVFPDPLDRPSRTIITGEGGKSPSRFKHVIRASDRLRRLSPIELERLNMFPDDHTKLDGISDNKRAFLMGNALVVGVIEKIGVSLNKKLNIEVSIQSK